MLASVLDQTTALFDKRFLLGAFFPSLVFWTSLLLVYATQTGGVPNSVERWDDQGSTLRLLELLGFIAWITFFATLLSAWSVGFLRFFEGYWPPLISSLLRAETGKRWHRKRLKRLAQSGQYEDIYRSYPLPIEAHFPQVMPTRLGNILRSSELYSKDRYGIDAVLLWPRLYSLLPEKYLEFHSQSRSALEFGVTIAVLSVAFALVSGIYLITSGGVWWIFLACFWGGATIGWLAYLGALSSAQNYSEHVKTAFDLYRTDLIRKLRFKVPDDHDSEEQTWGIIALYLYQNNPPAEKYEPLSTDEPSPTEGES